MPRIKIGHNGVDSCFVYVIMAFEIYKYEERRNGKLEEWKIGKIV
jgi:hypothetical protein